MIAIVFVGGSHAGNELETQLRGGRAPSS